MHPQTCSNRASLEKTKRKTVGDKYQFTI